MSSRASNAQESKKVAVMPFTTSLRHGIPLMPYSIGHPDQLWYNVYMGVGEGDLILYEGINIRRKGSLGANLETGYHKYHL